MLSEDQQDWGEAGRTIGKQNVRLNNINNLQRPANCNKCVGGYVALHTVSVTAVFTKRSRSHSPTCHNLFEYTNWNINRLKKKERKKERTNFQQFSDVFIIKKSSLHLQQDCQTSRLLIRALVLMGKQIWQPLCVSKLPPKQIRPTLHEIHSWSH